MRDEVVASERARAVREAARSWQRAGFIGEESASRIVAAYPDDRQRFGPGFRALAFIFSLVASWALLGLWFLLIDRNPETGMSFLIWAAAMAALTEFQRGPLKRSDAGAEAATALMAVALAIVAGTIVGGGRLENTLLRFLLSTFLAGSVAAWRWGDFLFFLGGALALFGLLAQLDQGRLLWAVVAAVLVPLCLLGARDVRVAPSHRRGLVIVGAISILALYAAVHVWSFDQHLVESMRFVGHGGTSEPRGNALRGLSVLATAALPLGLLVIGWRRREPLLLYGGLLLVGASIATIRLYRDVMPLSFALILIGAACIALALGARRWLRAGERGERDGFTADPLFDNTNRTEAIRAVVAMASFTPGARPVPSRPGFEGGGGRFGGGGATGSF
ncbi:MAG: hypothetical protein ABI565_04000 [Vicinamibacteria bacterium]